MEYCAGGSVSDIMHTCGRCAPASLAAARGQGVAALLPWLLLLLLLLLLLRPVGWSVTCHGSSLALNCCVPSSCSPRCPCLARLSPPCSGLDEDMISYICAQTLAGLSYLHSLGKVRGRLYLCC